MTQDRQTNEIIIQLKDLRRAKKLTTATIQAEFELSLFTTNKILSFHLTPTAQQLADIKKLIERYK